MIKNLIFTISGEKNESILDLAEWCKKTKEYNFDEYDKVVMERIKGKCLKGYSDSGYSPLSFNWSEINTMYKLLHYYIKENCDVNALENRHEISEHDRLYLELEECLESKLGLRSMQD